MRIGGIAALLQRARECGGVGARAERPRIARAHAQQCSVVADALCRRGIRPELTMRDDRLALDVLRGHCARLRAVPGGTRLDAEKIEAVRTLRGCRNRPTPIALQSRVRDQSMRV